MLSVLLETACVADPLEAMLSVLSAVLLKTVLLVTVLVATELSVLTLLETARLVVLLEAGLSVLLAVLVETVPPAQLITCASQSAEQTHFQAGPTSELRPQAAIGSSAWSSFPQRRIRNLHQPGHRLHRPKCRTEQTVVPAKDPIRHQDES